MKRLLGFLGLCARAGKLITGEKACVQAIRNHTVFAVLLDETAAHNAEKAITNACTSHEVPLIRIPQDCLGQCIGKPGRMVAAVTDEKMAARLLELGRTATE